MDDLLKRAFFADDPVQRIANATMPEEDKNLIRLAAFEFEYEAILLKNALVDNGVPAWVTGGDGVNTFGAGLTAAGLVGVDVNIRQIDLETGRKVLAQFKSESKAIAVPAWTCHCGAEVDEGFAICWSCGAEFESEEQQD